MLIVQKYGGTSVGNPDRIKNVAARVAKYRAKGDQVVVVVTQAIEAPDDVQMREAFDVGQAVGELGKQFERAARLVLRAAAFGNL